MASYLRCLVLLIAAVAAVLGMTGCTFYASSLPPLLRAVSSGKGSYWGACPPVSASMRKQIELYEPAHSPELELRLKAQFPPGTKAEQLTAALSTQGFRMLEPCDTDPTIKVARFDGRATMMLSITAVIYWKVDDQQRIVWVHGLVGYSGPI